MTLKNRLLITATVCLVLGVLIVWPAVRLGILVFALACALTATYLCPD